MSRAAGYDRRGVPFRPACFESLPVSVGREVGMVRRRMEPAARLVLDRTEDFFGLRGDPRRIVQQTVGVPAVPAPQLLDRIQVLQPVPIEADVLATRYDRRPQQRKHHTLIDFNEDIQDHEWNDHAVDERSRHQGPYPRWPCLPSPRPRRTRTAAP